MEEPNGAKTNLSKCSSAAFAQSFSSVSAKQSEQTSAFKFAQILVIEVVRSVINLLLCHKKTYTQTHKSGITQRFSSRKRAGYVFCPIRLTRFHWSAGSASTSNKKINTPTHTHTHPHTQARCWSSGSTVGPPVCYRSRSMSSYAYSARTHAARPFQHPRRTRRATNRDDSLAADVVTKEQFDKKDPVHAGVRGMRMREV